MLSLNGGSSALKISQDFITAVVRRFLMKCENESVIGSKIWVICSVLKLIPFALLSVPLAGTIMRERGHKASDI